VAKVVTSKAGGTISQQAAVHPWLAADAHGNKQTNMHVYQVVVYNKPTCSQLNEDKSKIITNFTLN
jgi:hypothetical protein